MNDVPPGWASYPACNDQGKPTNLRHYVELRMIDCVSDGDALKKTARLQIHLANIHVNVPASIVLDDIENDPTVIKEWS